MHLPERQSWVLKTVIDTYVSTAEPVGSKSIAEQSETRISSATIRNELAELEAKGYLVQPHTSAGRVPTDKAYREYVERLMTPRELMLQEKLELKGQLHRDIYEITELLQKATSLLSESTGYTSVTLTPSEKESFISQLKLLQVESGRVLIVLVLSAGIVKDRVFRAHEYLTQEDLLKVSNALEEQLSTVPIKDLTLMTVESAAEGVELPESILNQLLYEAYITIKQSERLDVYLDGVQRLFVHPEFQDTDNAHRVYNALHTDGLITGYLHELNESENPFMIRIGQEIKLDGLEACSLITSSYQLGDRLIGRIGIIGPKRMDYERVIPRISFIKETVGDYFNKDEKQGMEIIE